MKAMHLPLLDNKENESVDCLILTIPLTITTIPLMAPASLKPIVEKAGLTCKTIDINKDVRDFIVNHELKNELSAFLARYENHEYENKDVVHIISELYNNIVNDLLSFNAKIICVSLLTNHSQMSARWILYLIKKAMPDIKIIAGGAGCMNAFVGDSAFVTFMLNSKYIDFHIRGDGEHALYELLSKNETYNGINDDSWKQLSQSELAQLPTPDYSDYDLKSYKSQLLPILGSRGCVRHCQYCDYIENWKKFTWRTADDVFNEMKVQYKKYGIRSFKFQDSLINGNLREFNKLLELLTIWNESNPNDAFSWGGFYIFRNSTRNSDHEWDILKRAGGTILTVGIESISEKTRNTIGKQFTNNSIDYHLSKALEHNVQLSFFFIVGYVGETEYHINLAKDWLRSHTQYKDILHIKWGEGLAVLPQTYLFNHADELGIQLIGVNGNWIDLNTGINVAQRSKWIAELNELSIELGYTVRKELDDHYLLENMLNERNTT